MKRLLFVALFLLAFPRGAWGQLPASARTAMLTPAPPPPAELDAPLSRNAGDDAAGDDREPAAWLVWGGVGSYVAGAAAGGYTARLLLPPDSTGKRSFPLSVQEVVGGVLGGSLGSAAFVHLAGPHGGSFVPTAGAAALSQVVVLGGAFALSSLAALTGSRGLTEAAGWLSFGGIMSAPFAATFAAEYASRRTSR